MTPPDDPTETISHVDHLEVQGAENRHLTEVQDQDFMRGI